MMPATQREGKGKQSNAPESQIFRSNFVVVVVGKRTRARRMMPAAQREEKGKQLNTPERQLFRSNFVEVVVGKRTRARHLLEGRERETVKRKQSKGSCFDPFLS